MTKSDDAEIERSGKFIDELEAGVRSVLKKKGATASERLNAVQAGVKLLAIRWKIEGGDDDSSFFK